MENLIQLQDVLLDSADLSWKDSLCLPKDKNWSLKSKGYLFNLDNLEDNEEIPQFAD